MFCSRWWDIWRLLWFFDMARAGEAEMCSLQRCWMQMSAPLREVVEGRGGSTACAWRWRSMSWLCCCEPVPVNLVSLFRILLLIVVRMRFDRELRRLQSVLLMETLPFLFWIRLGVHFYFNTAARVEVRWRGLWVKRSCGNFPDGVDVIETRWGRNGCRFRAAITA